MAAVFQLDVLAASVPFFQGKCVSAVIPVTDGEYGVLAGHSNAVGAVCAGELRFETENGEHRRAAVAPGLFKIDKNPAAVPEGTANREMCTFLILNISSLQLIPVNIIAYRSQYGSVHPTAIVGPALAATAASTIAAVVFCKVMERMGR